MHIQPTPPSLPLPQRRASSPRALPLACALVALTLLGGCDQLGIPTPAKEAADKAAEGKAIGGACRHAARALEDCYRYNPKANKAAVFEGWKEMDAYMRENNLETITPVTPPDPPKKPAPKKEAADEEVITESKDDKGGDKGHDKGADTKKAADKKGGH